MSSPKIIAKVPLVGISLGQRKPTFTVEGVVGNACTNMTAAFEKAIGSVTDVEETSAMHEEIPAERESINEG